MQTKQNIRIVPVFNQMASPKIWHDFARLELLCDTVVHGLSIEKTGMADKINSHKKVWESKKNCFAFAAYDENIMVGFASGHMNAEKEMYLWNLYVNPQYHGIGIGSELLKQAECASSLVASKMSTIALTETVTTFYEERGYHNDDNRNMLKILPKHMVGVVPVFKSLRGLNAKLKVDYDKEVVKQCKNQPMFVYVTYTGEIDAVTVRTPAKDVHVWTNQNKRGMAEFYKKLLLMAMSKVK